MAVHAAPTILLLEDQALVRAGMRALIQMSEPHAQVFEAATFHAAVEQFEARNFEIAFLDIDLKGGRTGLDFLRHIRSLWCDTRAIMLSGRMEAALVTACIEQGASGYIVKEMEGEGLFRRALDTVFAGQVFLPDEVLGRGGYRPAVSTELVGVPAETLGVRGRALEVLFYLAQGLPNKAIANRMGLEEGTIRKDYVPRLFRTFQVARRTELMKELSRRRIIVPTPSREPLGDLAQQRVG